MTTLPRPNLDRIAMTLSGLCVVHCIATTVLLVGVSAAGGLLGNPAIHEVGLAFAIGAAGLAVMASALTLEHGHGETAVTIAGVALLALAHHRNERCCAKARCR